MSDALAAAIAIFALGFLSALALIAVLQRRTQSVGPAPRESVVLRLRAVRPSRLAAVERRLDAFERATAASALSLARHARPQRSQRPIADADALAALAALGYSRSEAAARLAAIADGGSTEERVKAALHAI
jgi:hypothetical protein